MLDLTQHINDLTESVNRTLSQQVIEANDVVGSYRTPQVINIMNKHNSTNDSEKLMNEIGLAIRRQGGQ